MLGLFPLGIVEALLCGAYPGEGSNQYRFVACAACVSPSACTQRSCCGMANAQAQLDAAFSSFANQMLTGRPFNPNYDPDVIDLPPDAVREVRAVPALPNCADSQTGVADSDGGECD